ncbi:MAG: serine/threonine-protein kinase [bacterium]
MALEGTFQGIALPSAGSDFPVTVLDRANQLASPALSATQTQVDHLVSEFTQNASDWKAIAAMTVGGLAYRFGRAGVMSVTALREAPLIALPLSVGTGLGLEVSAYELTHRSLQTFSGTAPSARLWSFSGAGGLKEGWISSLVSFGTLKGFGALSQGQNILLQHAAQDAGMVLGHEFAYQAGVGPKPEGSLAERFLHAEITNLQMGAGMALGAAFIPHLGSAHFENEWEVRRGWESIQKKAAGLFSVFRPEKGFAWEGVSMMASEEGGETGKGRGSAPPASVRGGSSPSLPPKDSLVGKTIDEGRYQVEAVIGSGGMGIVYRGTHTGLGTPVAIKVLRTNQTTAENTERFRNEARAASLIGNPHIIGIKDVGQLQDGSVYMVMEYLDGMSLSKLVEPDRPVPVPRLVPIARQIALGLNAAHRKGIVHRDLKPGNIHLVSFGEEKDFVKILDFGIAKMLNNPGNDITIAGALLGTPRYMSPEQAMGQSVDHRSDIYSFGVLLYKMATGKVPFDSPNILNLLEAHKTQAPPSILNLKPPPQKVPPLLDSIVLKCLSKNPADRYQSMEEVIADLDQLNVKRETALSMATPTLARGSRNTPTAKTPSEEPPRKSRWPLYLLFSSLGAGSIAAGVLFATGKLNFPSSSTPPMPPPSVPPTVMPPLPPQDSGGPIVLDPISSATAPVPQPKRVTLVVNPPDAQVLRGGQELKRPFVLEMEENKPVELEIRRKGFKSKKVLVDGGQNQVSVTLEREAKATPSSIPSSNTPPPTPSQTPDPNYKPFE